MGLVFVSILPTSRAGAEAAAAALVRPGRQGAYYIGEVPAGAIDAIREAGAIVEELPSPERALDMAWLEPEASVAAVAAAGIEIAPAAPTAAPTAAPAAALGAGAASDLSSMQEGADERYVVQFAGPLTDENRKEVTDLGIRLRGYVPQYAYKTALTPEQHADLSALPYVRRIVHYSAAQTLRRLDAGDPGESAPELPIYDLKCHDPADLPRIAQGLKADRRVRSVEVGRNRIRAKLADAADAGAFARELGTLPQISVVEQFRYPQIQVAFVRSAMGVPDAPGAAEPFLTAEGEIVGVADTGIDRTHPDLAGRVAKVIHRVEPGDRNDPHGHGTHVCGIIAGDGQASAGTLRGVAPGAKLVVQTLLDEGGVMSGLPADLNTLFGEAYALGVRIHNNSWGSVAKGLYTIDSYELDQFAYEHPDFLIVVAAGNDGVQTNDAHPGLIDLNSLRSPATSKNAITVGACCSGRTDGPYAGMSWAHYHGRNPPRFPLVAGEPICGEPDVLAAFSSRGPTDDNRIKPDLVAPGTVVLSAASASSDPVSPSPDFGGRYCFQSGTSMAAPAVTGAAAIVRRWLIEARGHPAPSAALLKAALINGCEWIGRESANDRDIGEPNPHQGFGRLSLQKSLPLAGGPRELVFADVSKGDAQALDTNQPDRSLWRRRIVLTEPGDLSVTLAWTDPPGHGLQHNLDLVLLDPQRAPHYGNAHLTRLPWEKLDRVNTVERARLPAAAAGTYVIQVTAQNTLFGPQGFAVVATGPIDRAASQI